MHTPVLSKEVIKGLDVQKDGLYIDTTVGEGGHLIEIAELGGKVLGIDADNIQIKNLTPVLAQKNLTNVKLVTGNFANLELIARENDFLPVAGILFDLGLSMAQLKKSGRGFSYRNLEEPLDMRLDPGIEISAADLVNNLTQDELYEIFALYGEEINSLAISKSVIRARPIKNVGGLVRAIDLVTDQAKNKTYARIFQALRIMVNNEIEYLKKGLSGALKIIANQGRIVVISFHSLEDRAVKRFIKQNNLRQINRKIVKSENNTSFERSAKMRIFSK